VRPRRALVTCGEQRSSLAAVRSLGRAGHEVHVVSELGRSLAGASRFAREDVRVPSPLSEPAAYADAVGRAIERARIDVLLPMTDPALLALLPERGRWPDTAVPFPDAEIYRRVSDKGALLERAASLGLAVPDEVRIDRPETAAEVAGEAAAGALSFPVVLKPSRSVVGGAGQTRRKTGVAYALDADDLRRRLSELPSEAFPVLLQRHVSGPGVGVFLLLWDGELRAAFAHRRIREKPPSGGVSVYRESIALEADLLARSRELLESFEWCGVAMVEYKLDRESGTPYVMEVNGRFWGSLQLAIDAGVDFPARLVELACGEAPPRGEGVHPTYRLGVRSRWWWGEVDHFLARVRGGRREDAPPLDVQLGGRGRALVDLLTPWHRGDRWEVLRASDLRPFLRETSDWVRGR